MKKLFRSRNMKGMLFSVSFIVALSLMIGCEVQPENDEIDEVDAPWVLNIEEATIANDDYREVVWTGVYMQMVLMSLEPDETIALEVHEDHDQFIRLEQGEARILMGREEGEMTFDEEIEEGWAGFIPAGYWHEVRNVGLEKLKLYTLYSPPEHAVDIIHETEEAAEEYHP